MAERRPFDPYAILAALERERVSYVVIGAFARVVQGADEITDGVDIAPSLREENLRRLSRALEALGASRVDAKALKLDEASVGDEPVIAAATDHGQVKVVPEPAGTRGYDDLRRRATREPIGKGLRPPVASTGDLARMLAGLGREEDAPKLRALRMVAELERGLVPDIGL